ncbi:restriction endonuclease subunit S [Alcaligenes aquatilis]|uniref:restriction endonuclease subunit S n=1 Tax=Alcaligenes aquatilis TaxID=323284 RepID=UPI003D21BA27
MNNKTEDKMANSSEKIALVPRLRFPEFRDTPGWEIHQLGQAADFVSERIQLEKVKLENYVSTENILPDFGGVVKAAKLPTIGSVTRFRINDVLISNIRPYLKKVWRSDKDGGASNDVIVLRAKRDLLEQFLPFILRNDAFIDYVMKGARGVKMPRGDISLMRQYPIGYPSLAEQQKIADCLVSFDALITMEGQKLDALKTHRKGLMQQLFPAEDEALPKLRFPEFRDKGEWGQKKFGQLCHFVRGPFGGALKKDVFVKDGYAVYEQSHAIYSDFNSFRYFITEEKRKELKRFSVRPGDIIMSCSGTMGKFSVIPDGAKDGVINQALLKLTVNQGYHLGFVKLTLELPINQEKLLSQSAGGAIKNVVGVSEMKEIELCLPSEEEQQKIASCLTYLDNLITAQAQKLEALKAYKKGLMQQLFPVLDEVLA